LSEETALPSEFIVACEKKVSDCEMAQSLIHNELKKFCISNYRLDRSRSREFFKIPLKGAISTLNRIVEEKNIDS
jgi:hypothetical protein